MRLSIGMVVLVLIVYALGARFGLPAMIASKIGAA